MEMSHPLSNKFEVYTPMTEDICRLLDRMKDEHGGRWRDVSALSGVRLKQIRSLRQSKHANGKDRKTVSLGVMDRLITTTDVGHVSDYPWYTPDELVEMGIWKPIN
jgi:hypothetical protein